MNNMIAKNNNCEEYVAPEVVLLRKRVRHYFKMEPIDCVPEYYSRSFVLAPPPGCMLEFSGETNFLCRNEGPQKNDSKRFLRTGEDL